MTIAFGECFCDNPQCRAITPASSERFVRWEVIAVDGAGEGFSDAHLCERCSARRADGRSLDFLAAD
jgi:hypothetical protein